MTNKFDGQKRRPNLKRMRAKNRKRIDSAKKAREIGRPVPENRPPENRPPENRPPENRPPENRSTKRMNIYYLLSKVLSHGLEPTSGCVINELNMLKALSSFANVYYNDKLFLPDDPPIRSRAQPERVRDPKKNFYDIYIVRGNDRIFNRIKSNRKIRFALPASASFYDKTATVYTLTNAWKEALESGSSKSKLICDGSRKDIPHKVLNFSQIVGEDFYPRQGNKIARRLRREFGASIVIGHFGRIVDICYPHLLLGSLADLSSRLDQDVAVVFFMTKFHIAQAKRNGLWSVLQKDMRKQRSSKVKIIVKTVPYEEAPFAVSACDITTYNYADLRCHYTGSMKNIESMACGVPVLAPDYEARVEEFGSDYPLFYNHLNILNYETQSKEMRELSREEFVEKIVWYMGLSRYKKKKIRDSLVDRAQVYSLEAGSARLKKIFEEMIGV
jgi:glycosyltransferase involved in cell wall biosynthesis